MRTITALLLLVCFAFYHFGYYAIFYSHTIKLESRWHSKIYSTEKLGLEEKVLEIPFSAPYMANETQYRATNTSFQKDGKFFRVIRQRYQNDTIQLIYVQDFSRQRLNGAIQKWISWVNQDDLPAENSSDTNLKIFCKDYAGTQELDLFASGLLGIPEKTGFVLSKYTDPFYQVSSPPPDFS